MSESPPLNALLRHQPALLRTLLVQTCQGEAGVAEAPVPGGWVQLQVGPRTFDTVLVPEDTELILATRLPNLPGVFMGTDAGHVRRLGRAGWRPQGDTRWLPPEATCRRCPQFIGCVLAEPL